MSGYLILAILGLEILVIFQIAKASEYVSVLNGEEKAFQQSNKINAFLFMVFLVLGLAAAWWCNTILYDKTLLSKPSASDHGEKIDLMLFISFAITGFVFLLTQILLFWFAYKYQYTEKRKVYFFAHDNRLEIIWTVVPALFLTVLVGFGLFYWFGITSDAPKGSQVVEITGRQFNWMMRYPGKDGVLGRKNYRLTKADEGNVLGVDWEDGASHDDIEAGEMHLIVNQPVKLVINAQDVIHDVGLVHFRMKMDAVPGIPTTMWFTPKITTEEMKKITGNKNFVYEISCDQVCGTGHYSMKGIVIVQTKAEYDAWINTLKPQYVTLMEQKNTVKPIVSDSTLLDKPIAQVIK